MNSSNLNILFPKIAKMQFVVSITFILITFSLASYNINNIGIGVDSNFVQTALAQNNAVSQDGDKSNNNNASHSTTQTSVSDQNSQCISGESTDASCNIINCDVNNNSDRASSSGFGLLDLCAPSSNEPEPPTQSNLIVIKSTSCIDEDSTDPGAVCSQVQDQNLPRDWQISVFNAETGDIYQTFPGSEDGTEVLLDLGPYGVEERYLSAITGSEEPPQVTGNDVAVDTLQSEDCTGTITEQDLGQERTCNITNTLIYTAQEESAQLSVQKTVNCSSTDGQPSNEVVCEYTTSILSDNFPQPSDYPISVEGNSPNPANFDGSSTPVLVEIGGGEYSVSESFETTELVDKYSKLEQALGATEVTTTASFSGDCDPFISPPGTFMARGLINPGETQECNIENTVVIEGGTLPTTLEVVKTVGCSSGNGQPSNEAVCEYVLNNVSPEDFAIFVQGNNPNPSSFEGSISGTVVNIGPGDYTITEQLDSEKENQLREDLNIPQNQRINVALRVSEHCTSLITPEEANGTIQSGESHVCNIENILIITGGTAPQN